MDEQPGRCLMRGRDGRTVMVLVRDRAEFARAGYEYAGTFPGDPTIHPVDGATLPGDPSTHSADGATAAAEEPAPERPQLAVESRAFERPSRGTTGRTRRKG